MPAPRSTENCSIFSGVPHHGQASLLCTGCGSAFTTLCPSTFFGSPFREQVDRLSYISNNERRTRRLEEAVSNLRYACPASAGGTFPTWPRVPLGCRYRALPDPGRAGILALVSPSQRGSHALDRPHHEVDPVRSQSGSSSLRTPQRKPAVRTT